MKFRYTFLLFILLLASPALACGGNDTPTDTNGSNSVEIASPSPTRRRPSVDPASKSTPIPRSDLPVITIKGARVNIRSGPGTNYPVIQTLDQNDTAPATGFNSGQTWVRIKLPNGRAGWVSTDLVDIDNSDVISIVSNIPPAPDAATSSQQPPSSDNDGGLTDGGSGEITENPAPVATPSSQPPPSSDNTGGSSSGTSGGNGGNAFQCVGGCATPPDSSCAIKGNVNSSGEKIYHVPGGASYDHTDIKPEEGDRWFCTTAEAQAAGFRASAR